MRWGSPSSISGGAGFTVASIHDAPFLASFFGGALGALSVLIFATADELSVLGLSRVNLSTDVDEPPGHQLQGR